MINCFSQFLILVGMIFENVLIYWENFIYNFSQINLSKLISYL
jgi:hypothetical protein